MPSKKTTRIMPESDAHQDGQEKFAELRSNLPQEPMDEALLAEMRKEMDESQPKNAPFLNTGSLGDFSKKVTDKLKPVILPTTKKLEPTPDSPSVQVLPNQPTPPGTRTLFPFTENEPFPGNSQQPPKVNPDPRPIRGVGMRSPTGNINPRPAGNISPRPPAGNVGTSPLGAMNPQGNKKPVVTNPLNKLAQRLESQRHPAYNQKRKLLSGRFEKDKQLHYQEDLKNPFVSEEDQYPGEAREESLAVKIKNGIVPAETLRLLISTSTTESQILAICSELNIDWASLSGATREEKVQYLIEYFNQRETFLDYKEVAVSLQSQLPAQEEQDWGESDARLKALQEALAEPEIFQNLDNEQEGEKLSFLEQMRQDFTQASPFQKMLVVGLSLIVITLIIVIGLVAFPIKMPAMTASKFTALPSNIPSPLALELPGGWTFALKTGVVQDGSWKPDGAEWLQGTEICKLISLPWNRQLDAIYGTLQPGDELLLTMGNAELLRYKVTELKTLNLIDLSSDDLNQVTNSFSPCLAIVLTRNGIETRQMIMADPVTLPSWQSGVTATPIVTQTLNPAFPTITLPAPASALPTKKP